MHPPACVDNTSCRNPYKALNTRLFLLYLRRESRPQHGRSTRCRSMADCRAHWENWKCVYVCEIVQACVWIIARWLCAVQWINVAGCQATAKICLPQTHFSHFLPSPFSFCLAHITTLTVKYDSFFCMSSSYSSYNYDIEIPSLKCPDLEPLMRWETVGTGWFKRVNHHLHRFVRERKQISAVPTE